jgi:SAM-dependent methyltransferase
MNSWLNDIVFPREQLRYTERFQQLVRECSEGSDLAVHLGSGTVCLAAERISQQLKPMFLNIDLDAVALRENPGKFKVAADAKALPLPSGCANLIAAEHVFEHSPQPLEWLRECHRVLRADGRLLISGPNGWSYIALLARVTPLSFHNWVHLARHPEREGGGGRFPTFYLFSTPRTMRRLAEAAGLRLVGIEKFVGEPCYTVFLPFIHAVFVAYHLVLEKLKAVIGCHVTSVAVFQKRLDMRNSGDGRQS